MQIPDAKAAVDKEWNKLETIPVWNLEKVKSKKVVILEAQRDKKVHFATLVDHMSPQKMRELEPQLEKYRGRARALDGHGKRRLWSLCSFSVNRARLRPR